jgi:hypothetical protein
MGVFICVMLMYSEKNCLIANFMIDFRTMTDFSAAVTCRLPAKKNSWLTAKVKKVSGSVERMRFKI